MSEKLLPIVPGCKALVVRTWQHNKRFLGTEVIVETPDLDHSHLQQPRWYVNTFEGKKHISEIGLMRIDGFDFKHERDSYELPIANEY